MTAPATRRKRTVTGAEAGAVKTTKAAPRKRPPARKPPATPVAPEHRRVWFTIVLVALLGLAAAAAVAISVLREDSAEPRRTDPAAISASDLDAFAAESTSPVYWAGRIAGHELELTTTADGTFVRYLPPAVQPGDERRVLTVATYAVANAYATAKAQAEAEGMTSRETRNGGLAVWSRAQPTSVYVAFAGVPYLVEVYAPDAAEARRLALSGRVRPVG
jgi:hypothetical protein